jgi:hypothetical protein
MFPLSPRGVCILQVEDHCSVPPVRLCIPWGWELNTTGRTGHHDGIRKRVDGTMRWNLKLRIRSTAIFSSNLKRLMISTVWSKHLVRREKLLKAKAFLEGRVAR